MRKDACATCENWVMLNITADDSLPHESIT
jgi:hypothetical protein